MPRPKRTQVARGWPTSPTPATASAPVATKPGAKDDPSSDIYDLSDREQERKRQRATAAASAEIEATAITRTTRARLRGRASAHQREALEELELTRDAAMERLDNFTSTTSAEPRPEHESSDIHSPPLETGRNDDASRARPARVTDVSGLDLDDSLFGNLDDSLGDDSLELEQEQEQTRQGNRSADTTSSFNVALFRRPRQSSIVGRDDAPIRPSSRGPNTPSISYTLNLGKFKRRAREPSILGTAQKPRVPRPQSQASGDEAGIDEAIDTDASAQAGRGKRAASGARQMASSRDPSPTRQPRKRKSAEGHSGGEKRRSLRSESNVRQSVEREDSEDSDLDNEEGAVDETAELANQEQERPQTPIFDDPDMLPPLSSSGSSEAASPIWPPLETLAHRTYHKRPASKAQKTPEPDGLASDISSPPSLTHSPNFAPPKRKPKSKKERQASPKLTTADLESLLPRRRHQHKGANPFRGDSDEDTDNLGDSGPEHSGDELSYFDPKRSRGRDRARPLASASANRKAPARRRAPAAKKNRGRRTYGASNLDQETENAGDEEPEVNGDAAAGNEGELEDEASMRDQEQEKSIEELRKAAEKFKEVDRWELDYEEVTGSSSPRDAR